MDPLCKRFSDLQSTLSSLSAEAEPTSRVWDPKASQGPICREGPVSRTPLTRPLLRRKTQSSNAVELTRDFRPESLDESIGADLDEDPQPHNISIRRKRIIRLSRHRSQDPKKEFKDGSVFGCHIENVNSGIHLEASFRRRSQQRV